MDLQSTWRVMGAFNPSRVIGDHAYKKYRPEFAASLACAPEYKSFTVESGDKIAICSDGFRVPTVLLATNAAEAADEMQKETDDRTCVFVNIL
jgi:serine/threonine protein phosphatase PrpC